MLSGGGWLDSHFAACRAEYEAALRLVPMPSGGIVLDAGCGRGQFLPLLQQHTGPRSTVIALDMAAEHLYEIERRQLRPLAGDLAALPLATEALDAVWCANVTQYYSDRRLNDLLSEFTRALKPGGLLAIKDVDMTGWRIEPAPPFLGLHLAEACAGPGASDQSVGSVRGRRLGTLLAEAGFGAVEQHTQVIERRGPLDEASAAFWSEWLTYLAGVAGSQKLPDEDQAFWAALSTSAGASDFVSRPDFYGCEMQVVAYGRKPEDERA